MDQLSLAQLMLRHLFQQNSNSSRSTSEMPPAVWQTSSFPVHVLPNSASPAIVTVILWHHHGTGRISLQRHDTGYVYWL